MSNVIVRPEFLKKRAVLIYTTVSAVDERTECGEEIRGTLFCNLSAGKAAFDSEEPLFFDYVKAIELKDDDTIEIITFDDDEWVFGFEE